MVMSATFEERFKTMHRLEGEPEQTIGELELERIKWPKAASLAPLPVYLAPAFFPLTVHRSLFFCAALSPVGSTSSMP